MYAPPFTQCHRYFYCGRLNVPPYSKNKSKAQQRMKFYLSEHGKMSMADARGLARASKGSKLPQHVRKKRKMK